MNTMDRLARATGTETHVTINLGDGETTTVVIYLNSQEHIGDVWSICLDELMALGFENFEIVTIAFRCKREESVASRILRTLAVSFHGALIR